MFKKEDAKEPSYLSVLLSNKTSNQRSGVSNEKQLKEFVLETDFPKLGTIKPQADQRLTKKNTRVLIDCDLDVLHYLNRISNIDSEEPARILFRKNINLKTLLYLISNQSAINRYLVDIELYELLVDISTIVSMNGWTPMEKKCARAQSLNIEKRVSQRVLSSSLLYTKKKDSLISKLNKNIRFDDKSRKVFNKLKDISLQERIISVMNEVYESCHGSMSRRHSTKKMKGVIKKKETMINKGGYRVIWDFNPLNRDVIWIYDITKHDLVESDAFLNKKEKVFKMRTSNKKI